MVALVVATTALVLAVQVWHWWSDRQRSERALQGRMRREVIVTLHSGESFSGVLFDRDALVLVLRNAVHLQPQANVPVDGELLVRWAEVAYVQSP